MTASQSLGAPTATGEADTDFLAIAIGEQMTVTVGGQPVEIIVMAMVLAPDRTVLTLAMAPPADTDDGYEFLWLATAVDSSGIRYQAEFSALGDDMGQLDLVPPVQPGADWLDLTIAPGSAPYRISLDAPARPQCQFLGPDGFAPVTAVLPELDGTRWVIAGLRSRPTGFNLRVLAWGATEAFSWSAHGNIGRWHYVTSSASNGDDRHSNVDLELTPAIDPAATSLDLILSGQFGSARVTVPLNLWY
ncbi:MAG TPA: hypothetical protein VGM14_17380 [Streptosporangiaceae bacterium]|jgi:hypothetical protein